MQSLSAPCERLVRSAQCVVDARLRRGKKPTDLVVQPGHQLGVFIPDTLENRGIQAGDAVGICELLCTLCIFTHYNLGVLTSS